MFRARHRDVAGELGHAPVERVEALDCLRGLMAWAVALYHLGLLSSASKGGGALASVSAVLGLHSVEAFFLISGFCFFHIYRGASFDLAGYGRFQQQRFLRLAPLFYLALGLNLAFGLAAGPPFSWTHLFENLSFAFGLIHPNHAMVVGGWSIGVEAVFYLAFPLLVGLSGSLRLQLMAAGLLAGIAWFYSAEHVAGAPELARFNAYVLLPNHAFAFAFGGVIAGLRARTRLRVPVWFAFAALAAVLGTWIHSRPVVIDHFAIVLGEPRARYVAVSTLCVLVFALTRVAGDRLPRLLSGIGELSYPVYLLHPFAWELTRLCLPTSVGPHAALALALLTTLALSLAARSYLERPIARWRHRLARAPRSGARDAIAVPVTARPAP